MGAGGSPRSRSDGPAKITRNRSLSEAGAAVIYHVACCIRHLSFNDRLALNKAIEALERAGSGPNVSSDALTLFGRALLRNGQVDRAEQILQTATTRYPVDPTAFVYYASAAERQKHFDAARQALIDLSALRGDNDNIGERAARIAALSMRLNDPASAVRWYQKAVDAAGPGAADPKLLKLLAGAQVRAGLALRPASASGR